MCIICKICIGIYSTINMNKSNMYNIRNINKCYMCDDYINIPKNY